MPILSLANRLFSSVSSRTQSLVNNLAEYCLLYKKGIISWKIPKVTNEKIRWKTPIEISPLKIGTKKPNKK